MPTAFAWGPDERAQLAAGYRTGRPEGPVSCTALRTDVQVRQICAAYKGFTIILYEDDTVWAVGGGVNGQLGQGTRHDHYLPVKVDLPPVAEIQVAGAHVIARLHDGRIAYWGGNTWGTRGNGTSGEGAEKAGTATPEIVAGITDAIAIDTAPGLAAVLHSDLTVSVWGSGSTGGLGDGRSYPLKTTTGTRPQKVPGLSNVVAIATGGAGASVHVLAILADGTVVQWGAHGPCGTGSDLLSPTPVAGLSSIVAVAAGPGQSFALESTHDLLAWGSNAGGELWLPASVTHATTPQVVLREALAVAAGYQYSLAVRTDGTLDAVGRNDTLQLAGSALTAVRYVHAGEQHAVALADHEPIAPPIHATAYVGGANITWDYHGTPAKQWEISQRPAGIGAIWTPPIKLPATARSVHVTAPTGQPTEVKVRNGTVYPARMAQVIPV